MDEEEEEEEMTTAPPALANSESCSPDSELGFEASSLTRTGL